MRKSYLFLFALMLTMLGISDAMAQKIYKAELDASMFKAWDSHYPGASEAYYPDYNYSYLFECENNLYKEIGPGSVVIGNYNVYYLFYADLTGTKTITFKGSPGMQMRVLMNRAEPVEGGDSNGGTFVERNVTVGYDGTAVVDVSDLDYVHLNAIKCGWSSSYGTITSILLEGTVKPVTGILSMINNGDAEGDDLSSFPVSLDGPNNGDCAPDFPEIIADEGVDGSKCFKVTAIDSPQETWHSQFYIKADEMMPKGSKWQLKMAVRADRDAIITNSAMSQPRAWKGYFMDGFEVSTEWREYTWTGEIGVDDFQSIGFDLSNEEGIPGNAGVSFYFDNIEFGYDLGSSNPLNAVNVTAADDVIRINLGGNTNMKELVKAASTKTLIFDNSVASVTIDGEPVEIVSVEGFEDGNLYIFIEEDYYGDAEMKVAFRNPGDYEHQLIYTDGKWENRAVPEFSGIVASYDEELGYEGYVSYLYGVPEILEISPEAGSFNLSNDVKEFIVTFNQEVRVSSVVAKLGAETLEASGNGEYSKIIKLTRISDATLNGSNDLVISAAQGKAGGDFGLQDPIVVKYSFGPVDASAKAETIYASNFTGEGDNANGAGWKVTADNQAGMQDANSGSGNRLQHGQSGYAADVLYLAQRSAAAGIALYGTADDYKLTLEGGKTYHLTLKSAQWDSYPASGSNRSLRAQVLTEGAVNAEDGTIIDETGILAEEFKAVDGRVKEDKEFTSFDIEFTPESDGNFVIRLVVGNSEGNPAGYGDGNAIADVKVQFIPDVLGIVETQQLAEALEAATEAYNDLAQEENKGRYEGEDLTALKNLIEEVNANKANYTSPSVFVAKAEELAAATKNLTDYVALCNEYDRLLQQAFALYVEKKESKFVNTEYFKNLAAVVNKYCTFAMETTFNEDTQEEETSLVLKDFIKYNTKAELNRANAELSEVITLASKWLTEGPSTKGWLQITTGYAALHERIRRGVDLLKSLGVADDDPLIVRADAELGDNDEIADAIALRAKKLILEDLAKGENSEILNTYYEDGEIPSFDLSVFFKNPNCYADAYSVDVPGWSILRGNCIAWSNWDSSQNHSVSTPYPEDCDIHAGWHPQPYAMVEQTVINLPAGVYVVGVKCNDNGGSWYESNTCAYLRTSETPAIEYDEEVDREMNFATYMTGSGDFDAVTVEDGQLTVGFYYGNTSQAFFEDITSVKIIPLEGYDYAKAYQDFLKEYGDSIVNPEPPVVEEHNSLYIAEGLRLSTTKTNMLPISLKNEDEIVGFQFDVVLPQGMTLAKNARGKNLVSINSERTETHTLTANAVDDFTIRVIGTSMENEVLSGVDGILLEMGIDIASWVPNGVYPIQLKDVKLTNSDRQTLYCSDKTFMVTVGGKLGDVNQDDAIDVTDAVLIIDHILMKNPSNFDASLADVNGDNEIDVTDVVMVIDAILGKIELSRGSEMIDRSAYTAFQMDLTIPAGYVLESVSLTDIAKDSHTLAYNMLADGRCRVVVCSMNNEALPGAWDEVIGLNLRGKGDAQVNIDRAVFVTIDGERHELMMNPTSIAEISNLKSQTSNLYDLQGRKIEKSVKGILIENGKKTIRK